MKSQERNKFKMVTLGCRTNQYETQAYRDQLLQMGYTQAEVHEPADLCIVNTCSVTEAADNSSRQEIRKLAAQNPGARIVVTGCSVEVQKGKNLQIEGVNDIISNGDKEDLMRILFPEAEVPKFGITHLDAHTRAFVKVQDGCNSFCTYCIIPYVRGRSRSREIEDVVREVEGLIANGIKEVVLTGINVGDFDGDGEGVKLSDLVRAVDKLPGLERLRLSSIDPDEVDEDLADIIIHGRTTCHSMHIVLQSGSNVILKKMNRKYTRQIFLETVDKLRNACHDFTFTTDIIVGFPGETEADFSETLDVIQKVKFAKVHMFPYSPRPRTRAALYSNRVPLEVVKKRKQQVLRLGEQVAYELRESYLGQVMTVLTEGGGATPEEISGHTDNFLNVLIKDGTLAPNQLVEVKIIDNTPLALVGMRTKFS